MSRGRAALIQGQGPQIRKAAPPGRTSRTGCRFEPRHRRDGASPQKNTIPPNAIPFIRAESPTTGLDVVRLSSVTSVRLLVSP